VKQSQIQPFMEDNWPWFTVPIAHDLSMVAAPTAGLSVVGSYGFPESSSPSLDVASVFLSKRRGALLLDLSKFGKFEAGDGVHLALSYNEPDGTPHAEELDPTWNGAPVDERGVSMPQPGTARTVSLALFTSAMKEAVEQYETDQDSAISTLEKALARLELDATATGDASLSSEAGFWVKLLDLMKQGAPQGTFYDEEEY
jgi:Ca-activated chloride channel family protein